MRFGRDPQRRRGGELSWKPRGRPRVAEARVVSRLCRRRTTQVSLPFISLSKITLTLSIFSSHVVGGSSSSSSLSPTRCRVESRSRCAGTAFNAPVRSIFLINSPSGPMPKDETPVDAVASSFRGGRLQNLMSSPRASSLSLFLRAMQAANDVRTQNRISRSWLTDIASAFLVCVVL